MIGIVQLCTCACWPLDYMLDLWMLDLWFDVGLLDVRLVLVDVQLAFVD